MTDNEISQLVYNEFTIPTLGITEQYLEIHQPVYENSLPKIERIHREGKEHVVIAYLPVHGEYFYFAVYIDVLKKEIYNVGTESRNMISLRASSEKLTAPELAAFTKLKITKSWSKGDLKPNKKSRYIFSCVQIAPNPGPGMFEDKLWEFLAYIEKDKSGIAALILNADAWIWVTMDFHAGNQILGGASINRKCIKTMSDLGLGIDFDFTAWGEPFKN